MPNTVERMEGLMQPIRWSRGSGQVSSGQAFSGQTFSGQAFNGRAF